MTLLNVTQCKLILSKYVPHDDDPILTENQVIKQIESVIDVGKHINSWITSENMYMVEQILHNNEIIFRLIDNQVFIRKRGTLPTRRPSV